MPDADVWSNDITIQADIQGGAPVIRGTRVPVSVLVEAIAAGDSIESVAEGYRVSVEQVRAALAYAADLVSPTGMGKPLAFRRSL